MTDDEQFESLKNELFRRIGRNLLNFQKLERMLKYLVMSGTISGPIKELEAIRKSQRAKVQSSTLGTLSGLFVDGFLSDAGEVDEAPPVLRTREWASISVTFEVDVQANAELRDGLRALVGERNELVHHLYERWDGESVESTKTMLAYLDAQGERLKPVYEFVSGAATAVHDGMQQLALSDNDRSLELAWLCGSPLVRALEDCAEQLARPDGWLPLSTAGYALRERAPFEFADLKQRYGYSTLKRLMLATELFEVKDEPTARGFRTVYRRKSVDLADRAVSGTLPVQSR